MTNYFNIYWADLTIETQEGIKVIVQERIEDDRERMMNFNNQAWEEADEKMAIEDGNSDKERREFVAGQVQLYVAEAVEDEINRKLRIKGEV